MRNMQTISIKQTCMLLDLLRCVLVILLETCDGLGFFWLFLFLTSTFLRAGENIDIKLSCIRTAKLITSLCCYLLTPETAFIFQKLNKTGIIWLWFSSIWNGRSSGSESELFIHLSKVEACLKAEIVHPVLLSSGEKKQQPTKWSFL